MNPRLWRTKDGRLLDPVKDMELSHLANCIRRIERLNWRREWYDYLRSVWEFRTQQPWS